MTDDRTKPHPLYILRGPTQLGSWGIDLLAKEVDWPPSKPMAIDQSWAHADALIREGYMLALRDVRRWGAGLTGTTLTPLERHVLDQALAVLESKAPGEVD